VVKMRKGTYCPRAEWKICKQRRSRKNEEHENIWATACLCSYTL